MRIMILAVATMFALASCSSGLSEAEVRELIQSEVATISAGPQGVQGERGLQGLTEPVGVVRTECHTHDLEHHHFVTVSEDYWGGGDITGYTGGANSGEIFGIKETKTGVTEAC
jgi:hypothetical protein